MCLLVFREAGVPAPSALHVVVYLNGNFFGLFAIIEQIDEAFLQVVSLIRIPLMHCFL